MDKQTLNADTVKLADLAADLSTTLSSLQEKCGHVATSIDISNIADELALLSQSLRRLHEAMAANPKLYTESFNQDLAEITKELQLIFEEITDCCEELKQTDAEHVGTVAWMFKKGRVHKLQKHLEALKTTVVVMRLVLWHGKDYGTHNSPGRLAESSPHTMHEDRVIMESVFAKNRNAIADVQMLDTHGHKNSSSESNEAVANTGAHHCELCISTGVNCSRLPDVLPACASRKSYEDRIDMPVRRFSKRGARLAVHSSILNMEAKSAPAELKNKWIQLTPDHNHQHMPSLSRISEVDSTQSNSNLRQATLTKSVSGGPLKKIANDAGTSKPPLERNLPSMVVEYPTGENAIKRIVEEFSKRRSSIKKIILPLRDMVRKLSISRDMSNKGLSRLSIRNLQSASLCTLDYDEEFENGV